MRSMWAFSSAVGITALRALPSRTCAASSRLAPPLSRSASLSSSSSYSALLSPAFLHPRTCPGHSRPLTATPSMRVAKDGDAVEIHYTGTLTDGTQFDCSRTRGIPLSFTVGSGQVIPGFDDAVRGLSVGGRTEATIPPERAYGERSDDNVISLPRSRTPSDRAFAPGDKVPLSNGTTAVVVSADEEQVKLDLNHELAGKTLTFDVELVAFVDAVLGPPADGLQRLVCAAGCFWGVELAFQRAPGVVQTRVGYTQGEKDKPTYREVCGGRTGHTEAVAVDFDPKATSYETLLELFWERLGGSALTRNRAGNDVGTQYRSGIYYLNDEQEALAEQSAKAVSAKLGQDVVTEVLSATDKPFYLAEEYHQRYLQKGGQDASKNASATIRCYG